MDCTAVRELAAELALGVTAGGERAGAVAHLASCAECRALVAVLSDVADQVLQLAPEAEAPPGFETRVLARLRPAPTTARRRRLVVVAAVFTALVAGGAIGGFVFRDRDSRLERAYVDALETLDGKYLAAGTLEDTDGQRVGQVFLYEGRVSWLFVAIDDPGVSGDFAVQVRRQEGVPIVVPGLRIDGGKGSLGRTAPLELRKMRGVAVLDDSGRRTYVAQFAFGRD
jgi:hypothetical protein